MTDSGSYSVRLELYYCMKDSERDKIHLSPFDLQELICVGNHSSVRDHTTNEINAVSFPLREFNHYLNDYSESLSPSLLNRLNGQEMTTLVYSLEKSVQQFGLFIYGMGKISRKLDGMLQCEKRRLGSIDGREVAEEDNTEGFMIDTALNEDVNAVDNQYREAYNKVGICSGNVNMIEDDDGSAGFGAFSSEDSEDS